MLKKEIIEKLTQKIDFETEDYIKKIQMGRNFYENADLSIMKKHGDFNSTGQFTFSYKGLDYDCLFIKGSSKSLFVTFNGAKTKKKGEYIPNFPRWSYYSMYDGCLLGIDDPMYKKFKDLPLGWYYGEKERSYIKEIVEFIIDQVCAVNNISRNEVTYFSSSGGGYAALLASSLHPGSLSISLNPQLYINNYMWSGRFEKETKIDLKAPDPLFRNDPVKLLQKSASRHVILINAASSYDIDTQLKPFLRSTSFKANYGLNVLDNMLLWIYDAPGAPSGHLSFETRYIFWAIYEIARKFKEAASFNLGKAQKLAMLVNEMWHDLYVNKKEKIQLEEENKALREKPFDELVFIKPWKSIRWSSHKEFRDITIPPRQTNYNYYRANIFSKNSLHKIEFFSDAMADGREYTYGIYNFNKRKIVRYFSAPTMERIQLSFITGDDIDGLGFCIYSGLFGETSGKSLRIPQLDIAVAQLTDETSD